MNAQKVVKLYGSEEQGNKFNQLSRKQKITVSMGGTEFNAMGESINLNAKQYLRTQHDWSKLYTRIKRGDFYGE